jgi:hypothetical protein
LDFEIASGRGNRYRVCSTDVLIARRRGMTGEVGRDDYIIAVLPIVWPS